MTTSERVFEEPLPEMRILRFLKVKYFEYGRVIIEL